jgi:DNA-directed RNA polymerase specialized sigma24 family protein
VPVPATPPERLVVDEALVHAHQGWLWRYLRVLGANAEVAADVAQEVFVVMLRTPLLDQGPAALRVWLRTTARNHFLAWCRTQRRSPIALDADAVERAFAAYERDDDGAGYRQALVRCLETVPANARELLVQSLPGDGPMPLPDEAARSRLRRLKNALRDCVQRRLRDDA